MRIQIKDLSSNEVYDIGPNGATLGRESARTDIAIPDEAISKRHARVFLLKEQWYLEDLGSSNGTFVDGGRIRGQAPLDVDSSFSLAQRNFRVVAITSASAKGPSDVSKPEFYEPNSDEINPVSLHGDESHDDPTDDPSVVSLEPPFIRQFLEGLPKSILYYSTAVPFMAVHPVGFVRKGIDQQRWPAMTGSVLLAYALPAFVFCGLLPTIAAATVTIIQGNFTFAPLTDGIVFGVILGFGASLVASYLWHPITHTIINILGGKSNLVSRTNYAIMCFATTIFFACPFTAATIFNNTPLPFSSTFGPLLLVLGTITMAYLIHSWNKFFGIATWPRHTILALSILLILGATFNFGNAVHASLMTFYNAPANESRDLQVHRNNDETKTTTRSQQPDETSKDTIKAGVNSGLKTAVETTIGSTNKEPIKPSATPTGNDQAAYAQQQLKKAASAPATTPFMTFLKKRDAIEETVKNNPALIRDKVILQDYSSLWKATYGLREKYRKKKGKRWKRERIFARQKDADIFDATNKIVNRLYKRIIEQ